MRAARGPESGPSGGYFGRGGGHGGGGYAESEFDDRMPCPHCGRKFNAHAAERHIPKCASIVTRPRTLVRGRGGGAAVSAPRQRQYVL